MDWNGQKCKVSFAFFAAESKVPNYTRKNPNVLESMVCSLNPGEVKMTTAGLKPLLDRCKYGALAILLFRRKQN